MTISIDIPNGKVAKVLLGLGYSQEGIDGMNAAQASAAIKQNFKGFLIGRCIEIEQAKLSVDPAAITADINIT